MDAIVAERYELLQRVAEGPVSELYRGRLRASAGFVRPVAVRKVRASLARDPRFVGTWAAASSEIAQRPNPHVEDVLDFVVEDDCVYIVTEWIEGLSLASFLSAYEAPPWDLVTRVLVGVLDGLERLHALEPALVHRGVTPASVRLGVDGSVKLTRCGVASALGAIGQGREEAERDGLWHAAPELLAGKSATPASDLFGVGVLAFEALAGKAPFSGDVGSTDMEDLASLRAELPPLLVALVERSLRPDPKSRFSSADEMARELEHLLHGEEKPVDAAMLGRSVRDAQRRRDASPAASLGAGPAALAASIRGMQSSETVVQAKRPEGLPEQRTIMVDDAELSELQLDKYEAQRVDSEPPPANEKGLASDESAAEPLMLTTPKSDKAPRGLAPAKTEFLDESQVDRLTLQPNQTGSSKPPKLKRSRPQGLSPAKTEFLDGDEVERLTMPGNASSARKSKESVSKKSVSKKPRGLSAAKTEFLDEDEVERLRVDDER